MLRSYIDLMNLFYNKKEYNQVSNYEKNKFYFMINKRMAIAFPQFAALLSQSKISTNGVVDFWQFLMSKKNKSTPDWLKITVIEKGLNKNNYIPSKELIRFYCMKMMCSPKDIGESLKRFPKETKEELEKYERFMKVKK